jgi:hypothetical protein
VNPLVANKDSDHRRILGRMHKPAHWQKLVATGPLAEGGCAHEREERLPESLQRLRRSINSAHEILKSGIQTGTVKGRLCS